MDKNIKVIGLMILQMAKVFILGQMEINMKEIGLMVTELVKVL